MASAVPTNTIPQACPTRLPKLSYRTRSCDSESLSSASTAFTRSTVSTTPTSPLHSDFCPSPRSALADMSLPSSPKQSTFTPSVKTTSSTTLKKRSNFLSSLFSAKEPSAQALQEYQRRLMRQGGGQVTPVGMPGVSSAKLPATVPKVNSKWDGVPQTLKEKEKEKTKDAGRPSMSGWNQRRGSSGSGVSEHRVPSTAGSSRNRLSRGTLGGISIQSSNSNNLAELYGWESSSSHSGNSIVNFANEHRPTTSRSTPSLQHDSSFFSHGSPRSPMIPPPLTERSPSSRTASLDPPSLSNSPLLTPYESSPATPDTPPSLLSITSPKSEPSPQDNASTTLLEVPDLADEVIVKSTGVNILGPPAVAKRKPKPTPLQPMEQRPKTSGVDCQSSSILRREVPVSGDMPPPSLPLTSYFPNTMTTPFPGPPPKMPTKHNSTRERLGLGLGMSSKGQIAHQSAVQEPGATAESERIITPTPEGGKSLIRKSRMALFKKSSVASDPGWRNVGVVD